MQRDRHLARGDLRRESAPLGQGSRASLLVDLPRDEMALLIELVAHLGVTCSNFCSVFMPPKALPSPFASPKRLMQTCCG